MITNDTLRGLLAECRGIVANEVAKWDRMSALLPVNSKVESGLLKRIDAALAEPVSGGVVLPERQRVKADANYNWNIGYNQALDDVVDLNGGPIRLEIEPLTITAPTGEPARAWTEQEKSELIDALRQVTSAESLNGGAVAGPTDPCKWTDSQVLEFLGVALRNVELQGTVKLSEIRQGFEYMRDGRVSAPVKAEPGEGDV